MKWLPDPPQTGDIVRVKLGQIYHYGVYLSDEEVIAFGMPPSAGCPRTAGTYASFRRTYRPFCAEISSKRESPPSRSAGACARGKRSRHTRAPKSACAGTTCCATTANILPTNARSAPNRARRWTRCAPCGARAAHRSVRLRPCPQAGGGALFPEERQREIDGCTNEKVKAQKAAVWRLLEFAMKRSFGIELRETGRPPRTERQMGVLAVLVFALAHRPLCRRRRVARARRGGHRGGKRQAVRRAARPHRHTQRTGARRARRTELFKTLDGRKRACSNARARRRSPLPKRRRRAKAC